MGIKEDWKKQLDEENIKYFVVKVEDFLECLSEDKLWDFSSMLETYNEYRKPKPDNYYWLINRDEYSFNSVEEFLETLKPYKNE